MCVYVFIHLSTHPSLPRECILLIEILGEFFSDSLCFVCGVPFVAFAMALFVCHHARRLLLLLFVTNTKGLCKIPGCQKAKCSLQTSSWRDGFTKMGLIFAMSDSIFVSKL